MVYGCFYTKENVTNMIAQTHQISISTLSSGAIAAMIQKYVAFLGNYLGRCHFGSKFWKFVLKKLFEQIPMQNNDMLSLFIFRVHSLNKICSWLCFKISSNIMKMDCRSINYALFFLNNFFSWFFLIRCDNFVTYWCQQYIIFIKCKWPDRKVLKTTLYWLFSDDKVTFRGSLRFLRWPFLWSWCCPYHLIYMGVLLNFSVLLVFGNH